jgi:hypothetical protein
MSLSDATTHRVPVDQRRWGLDRRSIPYAAVAFAVLALWAWVLPWVNEQVAWDDPIRAGEELRVTDEVTMTPAPGWGLVAGLRTTDQVRSPGDALDQDILTKNGVAIVIQQGPFAGTPTELLDQAELISTANDDGAFHAKGEVGPETTAAGLRGVSRGFVSGHSVGAFTTFVVDGTGIEIQVVGPQTQMTAQAEEVADMIDSLAVDTEETS